MTRTRIVIGLVALGSATAIAQYGSAPNNYYPAKYSGSTFTGTVTETKDDQITLTYAKSDKTETFTGRLETGCSVPTADGSGRKMMPPDIPKGSVMTAFFNRSTRKIDQQKINENLILAISFEVWQGQKVSEDRKKIYFCSNDRYAQFRAWAK